MVGAVVTVLVVVAAFAVDLGVQRVVRRDMQAVADVVALDLARELDGRTQAQLAGEVDARLSGSALARSLARNDDSLGDERTVVATLGSWDGTTFDTTADPPSAVRVTASAVADFAFMPGSGPATRTAYAQADSTACYRLGSWAAALRSGGSSLLGPLNGLLGLDLDLLSYQAIAGADLSLAQLAAEPRIGDETRLLTAPIAFRDLVQASIDALNREDPTANAAAVRALGLVLAASGTTPAVTLGDLLSLDPTDRAALEARLDVLDLVAGSILVADGRRALSAEDLFVGLPGVATVTGDLGVQQGASLACGRPGSPTARATSSQLDGDVTLSVGGLDPLQRLDVGLASVELRPRVTTSVRLGLAGAQGDLAAPPAVTCADDTSSFADRFAVDVSTSLASYEITTDITFTGSVRVLGLSLIRVDVQVPAVRLRTAAGAAGERVTLSLPPNDTTPVAVGGDAAVLGSLVPAPVSASDVEVRFSTLGGINSRVLEAAIKPVVVASVNGAGGLLSTVVRPLASAVDSTVVAPLARLLGLRLGGADVYAVSAVCADPRLAG